MQETAAETDVIYDTKLHWIIFFWPVVSLCLALAIHAFIPQLREISLIFELGTVFWIFMTWINYYFSSITIKKRQVSLHTGVLVRQIVDIPLSKIETIDIRQTIIGSILRYGALVITGTGGTRHLVNYLNRPLTCRRYIEQLMNEPQ